MSSKTLASKTSSAGAVAIQDIPFTVIKTAVAAQFELMKSNQLYRVDLSDGSGSPEQRVASTGDRLWAAYLAAFPPGTNPIYRSRTDHDCSCCRHFVRTVGGLVAIVNGALVSVWDIKLTGTYYDDVALAMSDLVHSGKIENIFLTTEKTIGTEKSFTQLAAVGSGELGVGLTTKSWDHFHLRLPASTHVSKKDDIGPRLSEARATHDVALRGLQELTLESIDTVLDLIAQNSLYRGEEHKSALLGFRKLKVEFAKLDVPSVDPALSEVARAWTAARDVFAWTAPVQARIRNTAIGTLLVDLSSDVDLDVAVKAFESKVAPANYKRPTALVTKAMIAKAAAKVAELGYESALERRYATLDDMSVNDMLFVDRNTRIANGSRTESSVFAALTAAVPENTKTLERVEEITIDKFLTDVVPRATSIELLVENRHAGNLVSLVAPANPNSEPLFKWSNRFSWSYNGDFADNMRAAVVSAGGRVDGVLRFTHSWNHPEAGRNASLMDLHVFLPGSSLHKDGIHNTYPSGHRVGWNMRNDGLTKGIQDVDYVNPAPANYIPIENITFPTLKSLPEGVYTFKIHNWSFRAPTTSGFRAEIEFDGQIFQYEQLAPLKHHEWVTLAEVTLKNGVFTIDHKLAANKSSKDLWGVTTNTFRRVTVAMLSPNYWLDPEQVERTPTRVYRSGQEAEVTKTVTLDLTGGTSEGVGNKHYFFMLDGCRNEGVARGFYNEFLNSKLEEHRKVFEMVGAKMKTDESSQQLSGLGFSSTQRNSVIVKVKGAFTRTLKVIF